MKCQSYNRLLENKQSNLLFCSTIQHVIAILYDIKRSKLNLQRFVENILSPRTVPPDPCHSSLKSAVVPTCSQATKPSIFYILTEVCHFKILLAEKIFFLHMSLQGTVFLVSCFVTIQQFLILAYYSTVYPGLPVIHSIIGLCFIDMFQLLILYCL